MLVARRKLAEVDSALVGGWRGLVGNIGQREITVVNDFSREGQQGRWGMADHDLSERVEHEHAQDRNEGSIPNSRALPMPVYARNACKSRE